LNKDAIVKGQTPPGTGVIFSTIFKISSKSTSQTGLLFINHHPTSTIV
jgi:hypothetical protein